MITEGQRFIEGKRVALVSLSAFPRVNGYRLAAEELQLAQWILDLSAHLTLDELADRIRAHMRPLTSDV